MDIRQLYPQRSRYDARAWQELLAKSKLRPEWSIDLVYGLYEGERLVGTCATFGNIIKCVAIVPSYQGGEAFTLLVSQAISDLRQQGQEQLFVYTKPESARAFGHLGFTEIVRLDETLVFLERGERRIANYLEQLRQESRLPGPGERAGAIVLNANPLTKGHAALIDYARSQVELLHLFIVSEERSVFPAQLRRQLVEDYVRADSAIFVHDTASYLVSAQTFPAYFLAESQDVLATQARLDATVFLRRIAPALDIRLRFVGEEPLSRATRCYNRQLQEVFGEALSLVEIPRVTEGQDLAPISASRVRQALAQGELEQALRLVPPVTARFLQSSEAAPILEALAADPLQGRKLSD